MRKLQNGKLYIDKDSAYNAAYGQDDAFELDETDREKYHNRVLVATEESGKWYAFEFFEANQKHGEDEIATEYIENETVVLYPIKRSIETITRITRKFVDHKEAEY